MFNSYFRTTLFVEEIQCLLNFHWDAGLQGIEICTCIKFRLPRYFSLSVTCKYKSPYNVSLEVVCYCFPRKKLFKRDVAHRVTEFHPSTKFHICQCCG